MSATVYGLASGVLKPRNDFRATTDKTGKTTASMSFTIRRGDYSLIRPNLDKGVQLSTLYPEGDDYFNNMVVDDHEYEENAGGGSGIDLIRINFSGYFELSLPESEKQKVYELTTSLGEIPIIRHPKFLQLDHAENSAADGMIRMYHGTARYEKTTSGYAIYDVMTGDEIVTITGGIEYDWFECIFIRDNRTYKVPVAEYTETQTDLGGLSDSEVAPMGLKDDPPNNPATPPGMTWMLTGSTETRSSDSPITWTRTWSTIEETEDTELIYGQTQ